MRDPKATNRKRRMLIASQQAAQPAQNSPDGATPDDTEFVKSLDRFLAACGGEQPIRMTVRRTDSRNAEAFLFEKPCILVGSAAGCDVQLAHPDVSSRHAYLQFLGGRILFFDLASRTGIFLNGEARLAGQFGVADEIVIGPYTIRWFANEFQDGAPPAPAAADADDPLSPSLPDVTLEFLNAPQPSGARPVWHLQRAVTLVGRSRACTVQLQHDSISRVQCSFVRTAGGVWVVDLLGHGGTHVNGRPVQYARLKDGYELQIGRYHVAAAYAPTVLRVGQPE